MCASLIFAAIERDFVDGFTGEAKTRALRPHRGDNKHEKPSQNSTKLHIHVPYAFKLQIRGFCKPQNVVNTSSLEVTETTLL